MRSYAYDRHHIKHPWENAPPWALELRIMLGLILLENTQMTIDSSKLLADVTAQTTVLQGVVIGQKALSDSNAALTQQVADLKAALDAAGTTDPTVQAALDAIDATVQANTGLVSGLVPAVAANTPDASATTAAPASTAGTAAPASGS